MAYLDQCVTSYNVISCDSLTQPASFIWQDQWQLGFTYAINHVVVGTPDSGNSLYICEVSHQAADNNRPITGEFWADYWKLFLPASEGINWTGDWEDAKTYVANDIVPGDDVAGSLYICTLGHVSTIATRPTSGASWATVWELFMPGVGINTVNVWTAGQRKEVTVVPVNTVPDPDEFTFDPDDSNDFFLQGAGTAGVIDAASVLNAPAPTTPIASGSSIAGEIRGTTDGTGLLTLEVGTWLVKDPVSIPTSTKFTLYWEGWYNPVTSAVEYTILDVQMWTAST